MIVATGTYVKWHCAFVPVKTIIDDGDPPFGLARPQWHLLRYA
jgi:hypothetical protein